MTAVVIELSAEQRELQARARQFADEEIRPIAAQRDQIADPLEAFPWDAWHKGAKLGLRTLPMPRELGGADIDVLTHCVLLEELAAADAGFGAAFHQVWKVQQLLLRTPWLRENVLPRFLEDETFLLSLGFTEPDSGSDNLLPYEGSDGGVRTTAVQQADGTWVLNGKKTFIFLGGLSKGSFVLCRTDPDKGMSAGATVFFVDHRLPGFRFGHVFSKLGWRLAPNAEMIFDNVVVPDEARVSEVGDGVGFIGSFGRPLAPTTAMFGIATAREAYELTLDWCTRRVQGGKPIIEHQAVAMKLADMWTDIQLARDLAWKAAWSGQYRDDHDVKLGPASQLVAAEMAVRVCYNAMQLWGGRGFMKNFPMEKLLRDSYASYHLDGLNDLNRLRIARALTGGGGAGYLG